MMANAFGTLLTVTPQEPKPRAKPTAKLAAAPKAAAKKAVAPKASTKATKQTMLKVNSKPTASKKRPKPDTEDENSDSENNSLKNDSHLSNTPPSAKKQKKASAPAPKPKKSAMTALQEVENEAFDGNAETKSKKSSKATDQYQKVYFIGAYSDSYFAIHQH